LKKFFFRDRRVTKRPSQDMAIDLIVERKNDAAAIRVLHLYVATLAVNLLKTSLCRPART
jgi:hypothetical protein